MDIVYNFTQMLYFCCQTNSLLRPLVRSESGQYCQQNLLVLLFLWYNHTSSKPPKMCMNMWRAITNMVICLPNLFSYPIFIYAIFWQDDKYGLIIAKTVHGDWVSKLSLPYDGFKTLHHFSLLSKSITNAEFLPKK